MMFNWEERLSSVFKALCGTRRLEQKQKIKLPNQFRRECSWEERVPENYRSGDVSFRKQAIWDRDIK